MQEETNKPEEQVTKVNGKEEPRPKNKIDMPDYTLPVDVEDMPKGKIKKLFRDLKKDVEIELKKRVEYINNQIKPLVDDVYKRLDDKFGGMYRVLIYQFLTAQEKKIQNHDVSIAALRQCVFVECYGLYEATANLRNSLKKEGEELEVIMPQADYIKAFDEEFNKNKRVIEEGIQKALEAEAKAKEEAEAKAKEDANKEKDSIPEEKETEGKEPEQQAKETINEPVQEEDPKEPATPEAGQDSN